jgi:hypothetical protein
LSRKVFIFALLLLVSIVILIPILFIDRIVPLEPMDYRERPHSISNMDSKQTLGLVFIGAYFSPILLYIVNYLLIPIAIIKLTYLENHERKSHREFSILNKTYIHMLVSCVILPALGLTKFILSIYHYGFAPQDL